mgnify:CR=1 FL=1
MKKLLLSLLLGVIVFVAYLVYNTLNFKSKQLNTEPITQISIGKKSVENFSKALQIKTISPEDPADFDSTQFRLFADFLEETYPLVDSLVEKKVFNEFSFLYKLKGSDPSLKPIVLMAHLDVVPVIEKNLTDWKQDPFAGKVVDNVIWGRGTIDDKVAVVSIMEALDLLLQDGFKPQRTLYISFGHDEEIGGVYGAQSIASYLKAQNIEAEFVLDEGMAITQGLIPGIAQEVALIGTAEKGFLSLELAVNIEGGHSSAPGKETAIDVLATAIATLKKNPLPSKLSPPVQGFINYIGAEMPYPNKLVFANSSLFEPIILSIYEQSGSGNALVRTTTAPTIFQSGVKENIIPQFASATVNFRILPEESISSVVEHVKNIINDERIVIKEGDFSAEASKVASTNSLGYQAIQKTIAEDLQKHRDNSHAGNPSPECQYEIVAEKTLFYVNQELGILPKVVHQKYQQETKLERNKVFISYSHLDKDYLNDIQRHFTPFKNDIDFWDDSKILPGQKWKEEIKKAIAETKVAILLVSTDFLGSEFIATDELPPLLESAERDGAVILTVILKPCLFEEFDDLNKFQAINPPSRPISKMDENEREELYVNLVRQTKRVLSKG